MSELKKAYIEAYDRYQTAVQNWNDLISKASCNVPTAVYDSMYSDMETARHEMNRAWNEYLEKELLQKRK